jgi:hypothetical protein
MRDASLPLSRRAHGIVLGAITLAVLLAYARLYFGANTSDEAFHMAVPYRFALGDRPFVDELHLGQTGAGLLATPFAWAYHQIAGLGGYVLFSRHLLFGFLLAAAGVVYATLRTLIADRTLAALLALPVLAFVPQGFMALNYYTLPNAFFTAGAFLLVASAHTGRRSLAVGSGVAAGLAFFSYPPFGLLIILSAGALYLLTRPDRSLTVAFVVGAAVPCLVWLGFLLSDGFDNAREVLDAARELRGDGRDDSSGLARLEVLVRDSASGFVLAPLALLAAAAAVRLRESRPRLALVGLLLLPVLALPVRPADLDSDGSSTHYVANLALLALPLMYLHRHDPLVRKLFAGVWIPGFAGGLIASWVTYAGGGSQGIAFFAAAIAMLLLLAVAVRSAAERAGTAHGTALAACALIVPVFAIIGYQFNSAPQESPPRDLAVQVKSGAYAGVFATRETAAMLAGLRRDLAPYSTPRCRLLSYYNFPAGYLLSDARPATDAIWLTEGEQLRPDTLRRLLKYFARPGRRPDVAVRIKRIPYYRSVGDDRPFYHPGDALDAYVKGPQFRRVIDRPSYSIHVRNGSDCAAG